MFTGRSWVEEVPRVEFDLRRPSLFTLDLLSIFVFYVQLILGAMFRHKGIELVAPRRARRRRRHRSFLDRDSRAFTRIRRSKPSARPAITMLSLMIAQLCLGFVAFLTRVLWGRDAAQPEIADGRFHRRSRRRGRFAARHYRGARHSSLAARPGCV